MRKSNKRRNKRRIKNIRKKSNRNKRDRLTNFIFNKSEILKIVLFLTTIELLKTNLLKIVPNQIWNRTSSSLIMTTFLTKILQKTKKRPFLSTFRYLITKATWMKQKWKIYTMTSLRKSTSMWTFTIEVKVCTPITSSLVRIRSTSPRDLF